MKKAALILALVVTVAMGAVAQPKKLSKEEQEKFLNAKAKMIQVDLELSDEQMEKFLPVYKSFQEELLAIKRNHIDKDSLTIELVYNDAIEHLEYQEKVINAQKKVLKELKTVLEPVQLMFFLDSERKVQKNIMKHKKERKDRMKKAKMKDKQDFRERMRDKKRKN